MHRFYHRASSLIFLAVIILSVMCAAASFSDNFHSPAPSSTVEVLNFNSFQKLYTGNDEISLRLNITADLQSLFTWNTKQVFVFVAAEYETPRNTLNQVSLWDRIIQSQEHAKFRIRTTNKYRFIDQGTNLRGKEFNLTMHWRVMPKTGMMLDGKIVMPGFRFPDQYI